MEKSKGSMVFRVCIQAVFLLFVVQAGFSQNVGKIKEDISYIWAESVAQDERTASEDALAELVAGISKISPLHANPDVNRMLMEGYSEEISGLSSLVTGGRKGKATALRYIHRDSIPSIFSERKEKILHMLAMAEAAKEKLQLDVALRNCSWAGILLESIPDKGKLEYRSRNGGVHPAGEWQQTQLEEMLAGIDARFKESPEARGSLVEIHFTYGGKPVRNVDYRFFNGEEWSGVYSAKDGKGVVEKPYGSDAADFKVKYESESPYMMHIDSQVKGIRSLLEAKKEPVQQMQPRRIEAPDNSEIKAKVLQVLAAEEKALPAQPQANLEISVLPETSGYEAVVKQFCRGVVSEGHFLPDSIFAQDGYDIYRRLIQYGNARLLETGDLDFYRLGDEVYCRSIPMVFSFPGNSRKFVEDVVLTFNREKKITNISFSLGKEAAGEIVAHNNWPEEARIILITFLENYKTAYALERLDYIESIFDDDALIITGRVLRGVNMHNELMKSNYVALTRHNKEQYVSHLRNVFAANEFINIQFSDNEVLMMGKDKRMFGIQISQDYYSTNYSDKGYLFLMVDLRNYTEPIIHVRTWQTAPDKEFGIIGPHHF